MFGCGYCGVRRCTICREGGFKVLLQEERGVRSQHCVVVLWTVPVLTQQLIRTVRIWERVDDAAGGGTGGAGQREEHVKVTWRPRRRARPAFLVRHDSGSLGRE